LELSYFFKIRTEASILTAHRLSKSFELQTLFENVSFRLNPGERKGLVGSNGCGKTTLMRILAGLEPPTNGNVSRDPNLRIGYLPQGFEPDPFLTLEEIINRHTRDISILEVELISASEDLAKQPSDQIYKPAMRSCSGASNPLKRVVRLISWQGWGWMRLTHIYQLAG
jgi:ATPase subunit of ABC transporter with duplicated ATPase domains